MRKFTNPFRQFDCPYCYRSFYPGECAIVSGINDRTLQASQKGFLARLLIAPLIGSNYVKELATYLCPFCKHPLPLHMNYPHQSYTIAILGNTSSGKSHYFASLINTLKGKIGLQSIGCNRIVGQINTDQVFYSNYYEPLFNEQQTISPTSTDELPEPFIYELVYSDKVVNLMFYDISGIKTSDMQYLMQYGSYIFKASGIIFLVDPMSMPYVVNALPASLQEYQSTQLNSTNTLNALIAVLERLHAVTPGTRLRTPIAITISKSDLLEFIVSDKRTPLYLHDYDLSNAINKNQFEVINQEVQDLIRDCGDRGLLSVSSSLENVSFFAVSATGWPPDYRGKFPPIEPRRCLDPLLWILWKLGAIDMK
jgi:hypothetical protein